MNHDVGHTTGSRTDAELPLAGYAVMIGGFGAIIATTLFSRTLRRRLPEDFHPQDIALLGAATYRLSRIVTKDRVTTALRAPFAEYVGPAGAGEVEEESCGHGLQKAVGELLTCPFCIGTWLSTLLTLGFAFRPRATRTLCVAFTAAGISDFLNHFYRRAKESAEHD